MPTYLFRCTDCGYEGEEWLPFSDTLPANCPECEAAAPSFGQDYSQHRVLSIVRNAPKTFGQAAEENSKRLGKEQMQLKAEAAKQRTAYTGKRAGKPLPALKEAPPPPLDLKSIKNVEKFIFTGEKD